MNRKEASGIYRKPLVSWKRLSLVDVLAAGVLGRDHGDLQVGIILATGVDHMDAVAVVHLVGPPLSAPEANHLIGTAFAQWALYNLLQACEMCLSSPH